MSIADTILKIESAGFILEADGEDLFVTPVDQLSQSQRDYLREHKQEIVGALKAQVLGESQAGNDIPVANDDRVTIHVPELTLSSGNRISCNMTVPVKNLPALRKSLRFVLKDNQGAGSVLGAPGDTEDDLRHILTEKYGDRLQTIGGVAV